MAAAEAAHEHGLGADLFDSQGSCPRPAGDQALEATASPAPSVELEPLTETERAMLDFERTRWNYAGMKEQAIREQFGVSATRYYQRLMALIDRIEARAYAPTVVKAWRRRLGRE